ncbi:hypothetical protein HYC85_021059 [Camellia sinensis]|uniref:Thiamine pyrophosphate enzyme N-terminal TPP-binding domain-containing protein n=1 Tax=Camellia sinensis TaxID=4442 RepID=A0A7J7GGK2_CAMSI|nr:hypothetical protein HYC85_021059 [Camellia sinensis]
MIKLNPSHTPSLSSPFPLQFPTHNSLSLTPISNFNFPRLPLLRPRQKPKSKIIRSSVKETELLEDEDVELLVETCITRTLPPALTLEHGLQMIKDAVDELKSNPPRFNSGMYRFQVAVPPSAKALNWFCCQPESSGIELDELEGISNLAATLVWDDSSLCTFEEAVQSYELALYQLDHVNEMCLSFRNYPNINTLWASLIIEECSRLGLTYFCIAPGSRSSPLAIAASTHPHMTCISCFDERSLAFHAVGYARGSYKPAVVITSSGTAVSNLLPAVVEASQDFVPLLLLTADRPPELHDAGANQAINQVNHFGLFVRFFYGLPAPTDSILARMVLTTLDSAVYWATSSPYGPVHINCPFREPLDNSPRQWMLSCLKGLDFWMSSAQPFTKYFQVQYFYACNGTHSQVADVLEVIQGAKQVLLLIGAIHREDDIWAALLLAKHLSWPVVADILSGLRLRKCLTYLDIEKNFLFIDHLDHSLLSNSVRGWAHADVIVQVRFFSLVTLKCMCSYSKETLIHTKDKHNYFFVIRVLDVEFKD